MALYSCAVKNLFTDSLETYLITVRSPEPDRFNMNVANKLTNQPLACTTALRGSYAMAFLWRGCFCHRRTFEINLV